MNLIVHINNSCYPLTGNLFLRLKTCRNINTRRKTFYATSNSCYLHIYNEVQETITKKNILT